MMFTEQCVSQCATVFRVTNAEPDERLDAASTAPDALPGTPQGAKPNLRDRQRALTRQALLDGARAAFEERGYGAVTIEDITTRAGASRGTFYLHFTKAEVLQELLQGAFDPTRTEVASLAKADLGSVAAVRHWLESYVVVWQTYRLLARAWMEGDATDPDLGAMTDRRIARTVAALAERILAESPAVPLAQARARAALMDLQLQYFCYHVVGRGLDIDIPAGLDAMASQWWHGLTDPPVGESGAF
jgi:AcrR family transcriptional regulator